MEDETQHFVKVNEDKITPVLKARLYSDDNGNGTTANSHFFNVSVRGWITLMLIGTVCGMGITDKKVVEPLYSLALMAAGFYLGSKTTPNKTP
jgi:hypothetical protein